MHDLIDTLTAALAQREVNRSANHGGPVALEFAFNRARQQRRPAMGTGKGYDGFSKSVNAVEAEERGLFPASVVARKLGVPVAAVTAHDYEEWHHTSSYYNRTVYYHLGRIRGFLSTTRGQAMLAEVRAEERAARRDGGEIYDNCRVEWLEWGGSRAHPKAEECRAEGCTVTCKGQTATVTLADGKNFRKRLTTRGFGFENDTHRLAWGEVVEKVVRG